MAIVTQDKFVEDYCSALRQGTAAVFAGAGLSVPAGFVDWRGLLRPLADELSLSIDREHDLIKVAQYHVNHHNNRNDLVNAILNGFSTRHAQVTPNHRVLARLPISTYWTTNYDSTIEDSLRAAGKIVDVKHKSDHLAHTLNGREATVFKMHGDAQDPTEAILAKEDYEQYHLTRGDFLTALAGDLLSKTFIFLGFSFADPNMDYVLSRMYTRYGRNQNKHYCLLRRETLDPGEAPEEHAYRKAKQEYFVKDLERYNIRVVMVDEYEQITEVLRAVEARYKSRTVFVSGAAHDYSPYSEREVLDFVHELSGELIGRDCRLVTGLGLGIGSAVVDGALQQVYHKQRRKLTDQLVIRPFPQTLQGQALWQTYREDMLDFAGLAIFMFGNKLAGDPAAVMLSNGVVTEFEIAVAKGIKVLPFGFTGSVARDLHAKVRADFRTYYPRATSKFTTAFDQLGDPSRSLPEQLRAALLALSELERM